MREPRWLRAVDAALTGRCGGTDSAVVQVAAAPISPETTIWRSTLTGGRGTCPPLASSTARAASAMALAHAGMDVVLNVFPSLLEAHIVPLANLCTVHVSARMK